MRSILLALIFSALGSFVFAQTKPAKVKPDTATVAPKKGSSCCSPSSKAKAMLEAKPGVKNKKG